MARRSKRREWTKYDVRELKSLARQKTPVAKIAKLLKRTLRANAAESVLAWRIIGFARLEGPLPFHPMTSSARARNDCEMINPSVFAVFRFTTSSNLVGR
jgi:hypothetical protein